MHSCCYGILIHNLWVTERKTMLVFMSHCKSGLCADYLKKQNQITNKQPIQCCRTGSSFCFSEPPNKFFLSKFVCLFSLHICLLAHLIINFFNEIIHREIGFASKANPFPPDFCGANVPLHFDPPSLLHNLVRTASILIMIREATKRRALKLITFKKKQ